MFSYRVTVLMTVYNGGNYLKVAIDSVLAQTFKDFEFLIVNDASWDDTFKIISSYNDPRIKVVTNAQNLGQTASLNVGLRTAGGEYVGRIDADDKVYPSWLEEQLYFLKQNPSCAIASMRVVLMDSQEKILKELNTPSSHQEIILKSIFASPINHVGCLMRRDIVLKIGAYDEEYKIVADYGLWCKLLRQGELILTNPKILTAVRAHAQSVSILEADKRVVPEMTKIITQNVLFWSDISLTEMQANLVWRLIYSVHNLGTEDFINTLEIFKNIYKSWKLGTMQQIEIQQFCYGQIKIIFIKRVWGLVEQGRLGLVRESAALYMKDYGWGNIFLIIWCLTFFKGALRRATDFYSQIMSLKANRKVLIRGIIEKN